MKKTILKKGRHHLSTVVITCLILISVSGFLEGCSCAKPQNPKDVPSVISQPTVTAAPTPSQTLSSNPLEPSTGSGSEQGIANPTPTDTPTPTLSPTPTDTPTPTVTPTPDPVKAVDDYVWTTGKANLRAEADVNAALLTTVPKDTKLHRTGVHENKWSRVEYDGFVGFISYKALTAEPTPTPTNTPVPTATNTPTPKPTATKKPAHTPTPSAFATPLPTKALYPTFAPSENKVVNEVHEPNKWGKGIDTTTTTYEDGTVVEVNTDKDGTATIITYPDGTEVSSGTEVDWTYVVHPDGSNEIIEESGLTTFQLADGSSYSVQCFDEPTYGIKVFFRYGSDGNMRDAVICNSDGSFNKWSGKHYDCKSISFGFGPCFNVFEVDSDGNVVGDNWNTFYTWDGPFYDY